MTTNYFPMLSIHIPNDNRMLAKIIKIWHYFHNNCRKFWYQMNIKVTSNAQKRSQDKRCIFCQLDIFLTTWAPMGPTGAFLNLLWCLSIMRSRFNTLSPPKAVTFKERTWDIQNVHWLCTNKIGIMIYFYPLPTDPKKYKMFHFLANLRRIKSRTKDIFFADNWPNLFGGDHAYSNNFRQIIISKQ